MKSIDAVRRQLATGRFAFNGHAFHRVVERNISEAEIREAGEDAEIIENFADNKFAPGALLLGFTSGGRPLHVQVSLSETELTKIVTIYEPDPNEWVDFRFRR